MITHKLIFCIFFLYQSKLILADEEGRNVVDQCENVHCEAGRECLVDPDTNEPQCQCIKECGYQTEPRRMVCSNHNETFNSDCELHQLRCFCESGIFGQCRDPEKYSHVHIEYYGECGDLKECEENELEDFPRRMREWLFNVMEEMAERSELKPRFTEMHQEAKFDLTKKWRNAAIWKWCELDDKPKDKSVSRHELFPVKAPLKALEHCIGDFLDNCDEDDDLEITFSEWAKCLEIDESEFEANCEDL